MASRNTEFYRAYERGVEELAKAEELATKAFPDEKEEIEGSFEAVFEQTSHLDDVLYALDQDGYIHDHFREYSEAPDDDDEE